MLRFALFLTWFVGGALLALGLRAAWLLRDPALPHPIYSLVLAPLCVALGVGLLAGSRHFRRVILDREARQGRRAGAPPA